MGSRRASCGAKNTPSKLSYRCVFADETRAAFDGVEWERRKASIGDDKGNLVFEQDNVEVPVSWSMLATNVVASKYFFGALGTDERESSVRQLVHRVARTIADRGLADDYFASADDAEHFYKELCYLCVRQYGSFNSPVWFNVGLYDVYGQRAEARLSYTWDRKNAVAIPAGDTYQWPQASACFIQSVGDTLEDIMQLATSEAMLFKYGSGTGTDLSTIRSSRERLSGGGTPSGPLSFMRVFDQVAAVIKSGGKTRRAAKMQSLKVRHPDIMEFIRAKQDEERKAWALIDQGYDGSFNGEAYASVMFQNANFSVRVTDEFMKAVEADGEHTTYGVMDGKPIGVMKARDVMQAIAEGTHICGDPGIQCDTTINRWHTCPNSAPINASNPCSEYMFLDDTACNLASINLMKFIDEAGTFDVERFRHVVRTFIIAQEILVDNASYPTQEIAENSHMYRPLGLGYANLGALIMRLGLPYDSDEARALAGAITAIMHGQANLTSQEMAAFRGPFEGYRKNREPMCRIMTMHHAAVADIPEFESSSHLKTAADQIWHQVIDQSHETGFLNAQVTVLAPTGTIGFMMDCDTTGVEPDIALVKYKQLAGGGMMKMANRTVEPALKRLGYTDDKSRAILTYIEEHDTVEGSTDIRPEDLPVFDCAFKPANGQRSIHYRAHLQMMAAVQPFLSGAISKTVNLPEKATIDEILQTYMEGWRLGLKAVAIYRDGSKRIQPLSTRRNKVEKEASLFGEEDVERAKRQPFRRRMPDTRHSLTHKFDVAGHQGYLTVGIYEDGAPGELFITMAKEGSTVGGTMDAFGTAISLCLQYGVPLDELCRKFTHSRFEPSGFTKNADIPMAKSIVDYIFRWLAHSFPGGYVHKKRSESVDPQRAQGETAPAAVDLHARVDAQFGHFCEDAPACDVCGSITVRNGTCYRCYNCGNSMGCS